MSNFSQEDLITFLYQNVTTFKNGTLIKDTSRLSKVKFDCYVDSTISAPLSYTVFNLSDKGELLIDSAARVIESEAAYFLFINPTHGWMFAVKNTLQNQKKLINQEPIQHYRVKLIQ